MKSTSTDDVLSTIPLFSELSKKDLRQVARLTTRLRLAPGRELTRQGALGREFIVVLSGEVDVLIDGQVVASCGPGDFFGEIALLEHQPRNATVLAKTDVVVDVIGAGDFSVLLKDHPQIDEKVRAAMERRVAEDAAFRDRRERSD